jgi:TP901 family phage tail tape measure protein
MASTVSIGFDAGDFETAARSFADALASQVGAVDKLAEAMTKYNDNQEIVQTTFKGLTADGEKFAVTVKNIDGALKVVNATVTQAAENLKALAKAKKDALDAARGADATAGETIARGAVTRTDFNPAQLDAYDAAIKKIKASLRDGSISLKEFQELLAKVQANPKGIFEGLSAGQEKLLPVLRDLTTNFDSVGGTGKTAGERILISWQGVVRLFESQVLRQLIRGLINEFKTGIATFEEYSLKIAKIQALSGEGKDSTARWTQELTKLSNAFGVPQVQVAEAAYQALQSGQYKAGDSTKLLETALRLSDATTLDASESIKLLSGTMNAFGKSEQDAERISNILFKTIQSGNIDSKEFASGFAKLALEAKGSGVTLEELAAAVDTLTRKGLTFSQATSTIESVLRNISKPSKELQADFDRLGTVGGKAFVDLEHGLGGVLKYFADAASHGRDLGELTTKFTELQAVTNLTSDGLSDFNDNLARISDRSDAVKAAAKTVQDSFGKDLQVELNKVKTFFTDDIGGKFASGLLTIAKAVAGDEGLVGAIKKLVAVIEALTLGFVVYKGVIIATTVAQSAYNVVSGVTLATLYAKAGAFLRAAASAETYALSLRTVALSLGVVAALGAAYVLLTDKGVSKEATPFASGAEGERERQMKAADAQKEAREKQGADTRDLTDETKKAFDDRYNSLLSYAAKVSAISNDLKKRAVDNLRDTTEALKLTAKGYTDTLDLALGKIKTQANEAKELIKQSLKQAQSLPDQGAQAIFQQKLKYASDGSEGGAYSRGFEGSQQDQLIRKRIEELSELARKKYSENTKESVEEARKLFGEVEKLTVELFDKSIESRKKKAQEEFSKFGSTYQPGVQVVTDPDGSKRLEFTVQTAEVEKKINALTKERITLEEAFRAAQATRQKEQEAAALKEKARLEQLQEYIKQAASFKVTDDTGKIKQEYKKDPTRAAQEFQDIVDKINKAAGPDAIQGQFQFFSDLYKQRLAIVKEVNIAIIAEEAAELQRRIENAKRLQDKETEQLKKTLDDQFKIREDAERKVVEMLKTVGQKGTSTATAYNLEGLSGLFNRSVQYGAAKEQASVEAAEKWRQKAIEALNAVIEAKRVYDKDPTLENADAYSTKIFRLTEAIKTYISVRTGVKEGSDEFKQLSFPGTDPKDPNRTTVVDALRSLNEQATRLTDSFEKSNKAQSDLFKLKKQAEEYDEVLKKLPKNFTDIGDAADLAGQKLKARFADQVNDIKSFVDEIVRMKQALKDISDQTPQRRGDRPTDQGPPGSFYGGPRYMYDGGEAFWQARGSDSIPAMLREGETVMTPQASREFYPILASMNGGGLRNPTGSNQNGQVTNVGDIHVHVQGGDSAQSTIREIARGLRREIKRGTAGIT